MYIMTHNHHEVGPKSTPNIYCLYTCLSSQLDLVLFLAKPGTQHKAQCPAHSKDILTTN